MVQSVRTIAITKAKRLGDTKAKQKLVCYIESKQRKSTLIDSMQ